MRNFKRLLVAPLALAIAVPLAFLQSATAAVPGSKASGHGWYMNGDVKRQFSFTAVTHKDGTVSGQAQLKSGGYVAHFDISCLLVVGNRASFGGTVTRSNDPDFNDVYDAGFFTVYDNGEPGTGADTISAVYFDDVVGPETCEYIGEDDFAQTPIEGGNVQVTMVESED